MDSQEHDGRTSQRGSGGAGRAMIRERIVPQISWMSLGLGLAQIATPGRVARAIGVRDDEDSRMLMRMLGVREVASGIGLLSSWRPSAWLGARTAGDLIDLALLGAALRGRRAQKGRVVAAMVLVGGVTVLDLFSALKLGRQANEPDSPATSDQMTLTTKSIVVNRPPEEVYQFWLDFQNFPRFMKHLESVTALGSGRSRWKARGPAGKLFEWDAEMVENRPNELISWRSLPGASIDNAGSVRFERAPGGRGTLVRVNMRYAPPAGSIGMAVATLFGSEPGQEVQEDLRRFKQVMETGEVVRSEASIHARPHPARPPERAIPFEPVHDASAAARPAVRSEAPSAAWASDEAEAPAAETPPTAGGSRGTRGGAR